MSNRLITGCPQHLALHGPGKRGLQSVALADKVVEARKLPRKHKLGVSRVNAAALKRDDVPSLTIHELARPIDLRTDGGQIRHGLAFRNRWMSH